MSNFGFVVNCNKNPDLALLEGTFGKRDLGGIGEFLYMPLEALFACLIKRISILFDGRNL